MGEDVEAQQQGAGGEDASVPSTKTVIMQSKGVPACESLMVPPHASVPFAGPPCSVKWRVLCGAGALIVAFRGTEATNLLNWQTNIRVNMRQHERLGGAAPA